MADQEHIDRLKHSVSEWNQWRQEHPEIRPDLSRTDLSGARLGGVNLSLADLRSVNLINATLIDTDLSRADLTGADLSGANLINAILMGANLTNANLGSAGLFGANLSHTHFYGTNLSGAYLLYTVFANNDLRTVKGLVNINHQGQSYISLDTIKLPQNGSALHFLRGAGIPNEWIDFYRSTMMNPIQYYSCFISYNSADQVLARRLYADLQEEGVRCWFAPHDLRPGQLIRKGIDEAIHMQDKLLIILSKHSVESEWVAYEVETGLSREIRQK